MKVQWIRALGLSLAGGLGDRNRSEGSGSPEDSSQLEPKDQNALARLSWVQ